jgi:hypothetical protein
MGDMTIDVPTTTAPFSSDRAWQEIEDSLDEILRLAQSDLPVRDFHRQFLDRVVRALSAAAGALWLVNADGRLQTDYEIGLDQILPPDDLEGQQRHLCLLDEVIEQRKALVVPPRVGTPHSRNPCPHALVLCPLVLPGRALGLIEIFLHTQASPDVQQGCLRIVAAAGELAADYHRDRQLRELTDQQSWWQQWRAYSQTVHGSLSIKATAYAIVHEGQHLLGCDRVSLAVRRGRRCRLVAASGVDTVHRRATAV